jgi:hypothetical protein
LAKSAPGSRISRQGRRVWKKHRNMRTAAAMRYRLLK